MRRKKIPYGDHDSTYGHLYLPGPVTAERAPAVVLVHGGYWSVEYSLIVYSAIAVDLCRRGAVVWNVEYRRVEESGGGWPGTGRDVVAAISALDGPVADRLATEGIEIDRDDVAVIGHSAGGHLAAWSVAQLDARTESTRISTVIAQSAVLDLTIGGGADRPTVQRLLGATLAEAPERYRSASPAAQPPFDALVAAIHTVDDESVPIEMSRRYVADAAERGQRAVLYEIPDGGHNAFLDPRGDAHRQTLRVLGI